MKIKFYDYQAFLRVVEGLTTEGKNFKIVSVVNNSDVITELNHYIIILEA